MQQVKQKSAWANFLEFMGRFVILGIFLAWTQDALDFETYIGMMAFLATLEIRDVRTEILDFLEKNKQLR